MASFGADYYLVIYAPDWSALGLVWRLRSLRITRAVNAPGELRAAFGVSDLPFARSSLVRDCRIDVMRTLPGGAASRDGEVIWLLRAVSYRNTTGEIEIIAHAAIDLLRTRVVLAADGSAAADKEGAADSLICQYAEEAATNPAITYRDIPTLSIVAATGGGPVIPMQAGRRDLLRACQDICASAAQAGLPVYVDVLFSDTAGLQLRTFVNVRGTDRGLTGTSGNQIVFSEERDNLIDLVVTDDWRSEATVVYVTGAGQGSSQTLVAVASSRATATAYSWREVLIQGGQTKDTALLSAIGQAALYELRPRRQVQGVAQQTPSCLYGRDWAFGDLVIVEDGDGNRYDARIDALEIVVEGGEERIRTSFRTEIAL